MYTYTANTHTYIYTYTYVCAMFWYLFPIITNNMINTPNMITAQSTRLKSWTQLPGAVQGEKW